MSNWSKIECQKIQDKINCLLSISAITPCVETAGQFISSYFLIQKPDGNHRFILNLKRLNEFVQTEHFKLEDLRAACRLLTPGMYMGTIDLKDAYFLIPVHSKFRKFLHFIFNNQLYEFTCLPFGLSSSPVVFTKLMKPVMSILRSQGFLSIIYLDDILCLGETNQQCHDNIQATYNLLEALGFMINMKKSNLISNKKCKYLGFELDSQNMSVQLPIEKRIRLIDLIMQMENKKVCSIREFAQFIGSLISSCPDIEYSMIHSKSLERAKLKASLYDNHTDSIRKCKFQPT